MKEYRQYSLSQDDLISPFTNYPHEPGNTSDLDLEQLTWSMKDQLTNAFALHALNQSTGGGFRNEIANIGQRAKPTLKLTQRPRTEIHGHNASLWLQNYAYDSFLDCAKALVLHEEQTMGYPRAEGVFASQRPQFGATIEITRDQRVTRVRINEDFQGSSRRYQKSVLPALTATGPDKPRIRVHTKALECGFDCDCYEPGELTFTAPDYGSLRVDASWDEWQNDGKVLVNSLVFEESFLNLMFPLAMFADQSRFDIQLPDGPVFHIARSVDPSLYPTMAASVQRALSDLVRRVTHENVREKEVKVWIRGESPIQSTFSLPQESPSQKSPGKRLFRCQGSYSQRKQT